MNFKSIFLILFFSFFIVFSGNSEQASTKQRLLFKNWQENYQSLNDSEQKKLLDSLNSYSLYPYAQYQYFLAHLNTVTSDQIAKFIEENSDLYFSVQLKDQYIKNLTQRELWNEILSFYKNHPVTNSIESSCLYQYALYQSGKKTKALSAAKKIWLSGNDLPASCNQLFEKLQKSKEFNSNLIFSRIELALKKDNIRLARYLALQLPNSHKKMRDNLVQLFDNPKRLADFSKKLVPSHLTKTIVFFMFPRFVKEEPNKAQYLIATLAKKQKLNQNERNIMKGIVARNYFRDSANIAQAKWRDKFIAKDRNTALIEMKIRQALRENNQKQVAYWLKLLPEQDRKKEEWLYLKANLLLNENKKQQAKNILLELIKKRGFYAMYATEKLKRSYLYDLDYKVIQESTSVKNEAQMLRDKYQNMPFIKRIKELRALEMWNEAGKDLRYYLYSYSEKKAYDEIARYFYYQGWGEYSVQTTIAGQLWNNWRERFPVVYRQIFTNMVKNKIISLSYSLAISRQESALNSAVESPVGAKGLMQLMPKTAEDNAKKIANLNYHSSDQLYDPKINIQIGTYYLDYVYQLFGNNRILASAAYNAGPNRVNNWLKNTNGQLDAIAFIESIPFTETRNYVKSVLVYDYIYQLILNQKPKYLFTKNEIRRKY